MAATAQARAQSDMISRCVERGTQYTTRNPRRQPRRWWCHLWRVCERVVAVTTRRWWAVAMVTTLGNHDRNNERKGWTRVDEMWWWGCPKRKFKNKVKIKPTWLNRHAAGKVTTRKINEPLLPWEHWTNQTQTHFDNNERKTGAEETLGAKYRTSQVWNRYIYIDIYFLTHI